VADVATWVALAIALYGAGLATYTAIGRRRERREALRREVLVTGDVRPHPEDPKEPLFRLTATNAAVRPVEIAKAGVVMDNGFIVFHGPYTPNLPAHLEDGQSVSVMFDQLWIDMVQATTSQEIAGLAVRDSTGQHYFSEEAHPE
jgi:hypothetical protein